MPTYNYKCEECGEEFELKQSITDKPITRCHICGKDSVERIIAHPPDVFIKGEPTTYGQISERNIKRLGKYGLEDKKQKLKQRRQEALRKARDKWKSAGM